MEPGSLVELARSAADLVIPEAMRGFLDKRRRASFDILMEELRTGKINPEEAAARDEVAAMFVKFFQATAQGAAFKNLRIIAKVLTHKAANIAERTDDFIMWADAIGGLLDEEAILLAALQRHYEMARVTKNNVANRVHAQAMATLQQELVGRRKVFADRTTFEATGTALTRTGFVVLVATDGWMSFAPSTRLAQLAKYASLDDWANDALS